MPEVPRIRARILPRLKKEYRGKALGPSKLRYSFTCLDAAEIQPASLEEPLIGVPRICDPDQKPSIGESTLQGSLGAVLFPSDHASAPRYIGNEWKDEMMFTDSESCYSFADLPEIPDEEDIDCDVRSARYSAYNSVDHKSSGFYRCSEASLSGLMTGIPMLVCSAL